MPPSEPSFKKTVADKYGSGHYAKTEPGMQIKTAFASATLTHTQKLIIEPSYNKTEPSADNR